MHHLVVVVKAADEADLQLDTRLFGRCKRLLDLAQVGVDRLFAEDMLAGLRGAQDKVGMGVRGGADKDCVDCRIAEDLLRIAVAFFNAHVGRPSARGVIHKGVSHRVQYGFRHRMREIFTVQLSDASSAQKTNAYLFHFHALSFLMIG